MRWLKTDLSVLFFDDSFWKVSKKSLFRLFLAIALNYLKRSSAFRRTYVNRLKNITRHQINNGILECHRIPTGQELSALRETYQGTCCANWRRRAPPPGPLATPAAAPPLARCYLRSLSSLSLTSAHLHHCHSLTHLLSITTKTAESRSIWNLNVVYILRHPSYTTWNEIKIRCWH